MTTGSWQGSWGHRLGSILVVAAEHAPSINDGELTQDRGPKFLERAGGLHSCTWCLTKVGPSRMIMAYVLHVQFQVSFE